jgi:Lipoprotein LpqB beta-propeller domain
VLDEELRQQLADWARSADRLPVPGLGALRGRIRRRRTRMAGVAAGLAAAGAAAGLAVAQLPFGAGQPVGPGPATGGHAHHSAAHPGRRAAIPLGWQPAGPLPAPDAGLAAAPYLVALNNTESPQDALIVSWQTGRTVGTVRPPAGSGIGGFTAVAAAGDDRTFVLSANTGSDGQSQFYELRLTSGGRPLPLTRLPVPGSWPSQLSQRSFAISPDGRELAVVGARGQNAIEVITLASGQARTWAATAAGQVSELTWAGNRDLVYSWTPAAQRAAARRDQGLWLLDTRAGSSNLLTAARLAIPASATLGGYAFTQYFASEPIASADGGALFALMTEPLPANGMQEIVQFSLATGQPVRAELPAAGEGMGTPWCGPLWTDPSGRQLAATCMSGAGVISDGRLTRRNLHDPDPYLTAW